MQPPTAARTVHYHPDGLARDLHLFRVIAEDAHTLQEPRLHYNHSHYNCVRAASARPTHVCVDR